MNKLIKTNAHQYVSLSNARTINVLPEDIDTFLEENGEKEYETNDLGSELYLNYSDFESTVVLFDLKKDVLQARLDAFLNSNETVLDLSEHFLDAHFSEDDEMEDDCCGNCCGEDGCCDSHAHFESCCGEDDCCGARHDHHAHDHEDHKHNHSHAHFKSCCGEDDCCGARHDHHAHDHEDHKHDHKHNHSHAHNHDAEHSHKHADGNNEDGHSHDHDHDHSHPHNHNGSHKHSH